MRLILLGLSLVGLLSGQFDGLSATGDGSRLYFSSSLRLRGAQPSSNRKIFGMNGGPSLFAAREKGERIGWTWTQFYDLVSPEVTTDGSLIAFTGLRPCSGGSGCISVQRAQATVMGRDGTERFQGTGYINLSPNGRYAVLFARNTFGNILSVSELVDLQTGQSTPFNARIASNARHRVSDDGSVAIAANGEVRIWKAGVEEILSGARTAVHNDGTDPLLLLSADGRRLVYETASGLAIYDRASAVERSLATVGIVDAAINRDGSAVAFLNAADHQVYVGDPARRLTSITEGVSAVTISGDGRYMFVATRQGRIVRFATASGEWAEMIPRTPWINFPDLPGLATSLDDGIAPGSLIPLTGSGLAAGSEAAPAPLGRELGGVRVRIGDLDAAIAAVSPDLVWFQVPWELAEGETAFTFSSGNSPFETGPGSVTVKPAVPHPFATVDTTNGYTVYLTAVHEDWRGVVTPSTPARPGEIIYLYYNGLGPVSPSVGTGEASPSDPPAVTVQPLRCQFWDGQPNNAEVLFAGLAPTMVGIYQVAVRVPFGLQSASPSLSCGFAAAEFPPAIGTVFVRTD